MDTTIDQQLAIDEALVPTTQRLKIGRSKFPLLSDIKSKESTLQLVYDVLRICPFFKAFLVTANVPEVYMQDFWATATVHYHSIRFKEILAFIRFLGHSATIRTPTDVNINKLYQPWRSFAAIINKCLTGKSFGYDNLRLSQAQILWGLYHKRNVDYAYLMWEDFVYQVKTKNQKKSNEMYYPRFTKVIIHHFMSKNPSIPRSYKVNWHYVRDDHMFSTIKLVSRHQNTQQFGALLPIELTNDEIRNSKAYKEYYAIATGEAVPKPKASVRRTRSSSDTSVTPPTAAASLRLTASAKGKQTAKASKAKSLSALFKVAMTEAQQLKLVTKRSMQQTHISQPSRSCAEEGTSDDNEGKDDDGDEKDKDDDGQEGNGDDDDEDDDGEEGDDGADQEVVRDDDKDDNEEGGDDEHESDKETKEEESFDPILQTPEDSDDEGDSEEDLGLNISEEERHVEEEEEDKLYRDVNINQGRGIQATLAVEDSHVTLTSVIPDGQQESSSVSSQFVTSMLNPTLDVGMESIFGTTSQMDVQTPTSVAPLPITAPNFGSLFRFDDRLRSLEENFFEFRQTNQFDGASDRLRDKAQRENAEFLRTVDENIKKIIKEQVKEQVKVQVSKILPRIEHAMNEQLEAEVLTRSSHSSRTSYIVVVDLSEMELKKIFIEEMKGNKSIQRSDEQRNLYKALVDAYESDKIILDTYEETVTLKRRRDDDADKDEEPSARPDQGSKRRREGKEPESASAPTETATRSAGRSTQGSRSRQASASESAFAEEPIIQPWISELAKQADSRSSFNELMDTPLNFSNFLINQLKVDTLTPELLADYGHIKWIEDLVPRTMWIQEPIGYDKHALWGVSHWGCKRQQFYDFDVNSEFVHDVYSKRRIIAVTELKIVEWHSYKHLDWITIEYLVPRTMWIQEPIGYDKHALWGVSHWGCKRQQFYDFAVNQESARDVYSKRRIIAVTELKIVKWHSYNYLDWITRKEAYTTYSNLRGFIYQNKDKRNSLMRIDELYKFSDGTLIDVRTTLDDRLKGIRM
nr:hypothetical protein [Tanacetum cinerariifolium]